MFAKGAAFIALFLLVAAPAAAQTSRVLDIERFRPSPDRYGSIGIPGTRTPGEWAWNVGLYLNYSSEPFSVERIDDGVRTPIIEHRLGTDFVAQLGILDRLAVVLNVPLILWQEADVGPFDSGPRLSVIAFRDPYLGFRARLIGDGATTAHARSEGGGLAVQGGVTLPFGLEDNFAGEGLPSIEAQVIGDFYFLDFGLVANFGYRHRFSEPDLLGVRFRNEVFFGAALRAPTFVIPNTSVLLETRVHTPVEEENLAVEGDLGVRWSDGDFSMTWALGMGWTGGVGAPGFRGTYGIEFAPRTHDIDGDGLVDSQDTCERLPEDLDGFEDEDGCPDPDNDGDLIPDEDDRCPLEPADFDRDEDEDGCTDPLNDRDNDSIDDSEDACPSEAEDRDDFEDDDGCPDLDDDGDSIPDTIDRCRREAEDVDGYQDEDGCPDPDNDGDGVLDADDRCPRAPEDTDGFEDEDGCPEPDNDRDGVLDSFDRCAEEAETINGVDDEDGCADTGGRSYWRAEGDESLPSLTGRIRFDAEGAVRPLSNPSLDQLALHLRARWGSVWNVWIPREDAAARDALDAALVERGVPTELFEVGTDTALGTHAVAVRSRPVERTAE